MKKQKNKKQSWISAKIERIMTEGVRRNTHAPVSASNSRRPVSPEQAQAIAYSMYKNQGRDPKKNNMKKSKKSAKKYMNKSGKTKGKTIARSVRKRTATVIEHKAGSRGGETKYRFPMPDAAHARNALARLPHAKGLSPEEKAKIKGRAMRMLGKARGSVSEKKFAKNLLS